MKVFLSSTFLDLRESREAALAAVRQVDGYEIVGMEAYGARDANSLDHCLKSVEDSDIFVCLVGHRHGNTPTGSSKSFTEHEYEKAVELNKDRIVLLFNGPLAAEHRESDEKDKLQKEFIQRVKLDRLCGTYGKAEEITGLLALSLLNHLIRRNEDWGLKKTILLFPFVSSVTGFNTGIAVSNVGDGPGTQAITSGIVTFYCYGTLPGGESPITVIPTSKAVRSGSTVT